MAIRGVRAEALKRAWGRERTRTRLGAEAGSALGAEEALQRATLAMKEAARRSDSQGAVEELVQLGESGYTPDLMAATTALSACASAVDEERALVVFQEVFGSGLLEPDELAFTMLLKCFAQQRPPDWEQIASRLGSMRFTYSIAPSALTYNVLLHACARENDVDRGIEVLNKMAIDGVEPNEDTAKAVKKRKVLRSHAKKLFAE